MAALKKIDQTLRASLELAELDDPGLLKSFPRSDWSTLATAAREALARQTPASLTVPSLVPSSSTFPPSLCVSGGEGMIAVSVGDPGVVVGTVGIDGLSSTLSVPFSPTLVPDVPLSSSSSLAVPTVDSRSASGTGPLTQRVVSGVVAEGKDLAAGRAPGASTLEDESADVGCVHSGVLHMSKTSSRVPGASMLGAEMVAVGSDHHVPVEFSGGGVPDAGTPARALFSGPMNVGTWVAGSVVFDGCSEEELIKQGVVQDMMDVSPELRDGCKVASAVVPPTPPTTSPTCSAEPHALGLTAHTRATAVQEDTSSTTSSPPALHITPTPLVCPLSPGLPADTSHLEEGDEVKRRLTAHRKRASKLVDNEPMVEGVIKSVAEQQQVTHVRADGSTCSASVDQKSRKLGSEVAKCVRDKSPGSPDGCSWMDASSVVILPVDRGSDTSLNAISLLQTAIGVQSLALSVQTESTDEGINPHQAGTARDGSPAQKLSLFQGVATHGQVATLSMDESPVLRDGSSQTVQHVPSDAQLLYWTLVDDQVVPDGFLSDFERLMAVVDTASVRQARASFMDNPQAALYLHELAKTKESENKKAKSADDQFALAFNAKPKKYRTRFERTLYSGPTPRKDAEDVERSRWIHTLATLVMGTPTPVGALLQANSGDFQYLGAGRRASTLRSLVRHAKKYLQWLALSRHVAFPTTVEHLVSYMKVRLSEPSNRGALRNVNRAYEFLEEVCGMPAESCHTKTEFYQLNFREILTSATPGRPTRQAPRFFITMLAALELQIADPLAPPYIRVYSWWVCLQHWGTLRFSDHRGIAPSSVKVVDNEFTAQLTHSKTLGRDKKLQSRPILVHRLAFLKVPDWVAQGGTYSATWPVFHGLLVAHALFVSQRMSSSRAPIRDRVSNVESHTL